jgi:propanol-preferring alcohol dehydrogenase
VVAVARGTETNLKQGDRVGVKYARHRSSSVKTTAETGHRWVASSCNRCQFCRQGYEPLCPEAQCSGCTVDGTFAQYAARLAA